MPGSVTLTPVATGSPAVPCSESLACSNTLVTCSDLGLILLTTVSGSLTFGLIATGGTLFCSESLACSDNLACSDHSLTLTAE